VRNTGWMRIEAGRSRRYTFGASSSLFSSGGSFRCCDCACDAYKIDLVSRASTALESSYLPDIRELLRRLGVGCGSDSGWRRRHVAFVVEP
jgi:hypothetical protein